MSTVRGRRKLRPPTISKSSREPEQEQASRKSLSILQPAADNPTSLVGCYGTPTPTSQKVEILKPVLAAKENSPMKTRQSKRKVVKQNSPMKKRQSKIKAASSSQVSKIKSSTPISNDTKSPENGNVKQQTLEKYCKKLADKLEENDLVALEDKEHLDHRETSLSGISIPSESSGYFSDGLEKPEGGLKAGDISVSTSEAADDGEAAKTDDPVTASEGLQNDLAAVIGQELYDILCTDKVPESYWKGLAEERDQALKEVLHENELLQARLDILEAENSRLESYYVHAKNLAESVQEVFGD